MATKEQKAIENYVNLLLKVTFRICHWDENGVLKSRSSGFLYKKSEESPLLVITAGHHTPPEGSFIETTHVYENRTAAVNAGKFQVFYNNNDIDYAYSILPLELIQKSLSNDMAFEFTVYKEPMYKAVASEVYGFAVRNNYEFVKYSDALVAPTYLCHELYMELVKQDEHINYFKPSRPIQDHEFYNGASGSPITDQYGRITSILIGGTDPIEFLRGFRLDNINLP
jgi:hypothetical protein